ncbi:MAG TPA: esterase-like activity of phytase family protein [Kofleriaceae bacterium]|nr:esterase-like activity of phytase family protein [Kofleriaceae bacterium]
MRLALVCLLIACGHAPPPDRAAYDEIVLDSPPGVSDLARDDRGKLWAIPERDRVVLEVSFPDGAIVRHPLDGAPEHVDTESMAWLGAGKFAIGTEGQDAPTASILWAEARGDRIVVTSERPITDEELGLHMKVNHGAEGMCGRGDDLLVGIEETGRLAGGQRWAPIVRLHAGTLVGTSRLLLTSATGKISALACTFGADGRADVYAIERHYEVSRIIHFSVAPIAGEITPEIVMDLDPLFHGAFNMEGIVRLPDGRFVLVNDNQGHKAEGPTALFVLHPPAK